MKPRRYFWPEGSEKQQQMLLQDLLQQRAEAPAPGAAPSANTYGSIQEGLTQLGAGIAHRTATSRRNRLDEQIQAIDPTGEIVRALMRRQ